MASVRKSLAISFAEKYSTIIIQFISTIILARLLTPEDIGIFSVGALIIGLTHMIRDFGVSNYIIQEKELTTTRIRTALGVTLVIAWTLAIISFSMAETISQFYEEPRIKQVIYVLSATFFFIPFSSTIFGLLRREMNFSALLWINITSSLVNALVSIILAFQGYGFMSLAWAAAAGTLTTVLLCILLRPKNAQFKPSFKEFRRIFSFGSKSSVASISLEVGNSAPELIIGKVMSFEAVGYFSRAMGLASLFNKLISSAVYSVALPFFAKKNRSNENLKPPVLLTINYMLGISWPFYCFAIIYAPEIIELLFGGQWGPSVPVAQILCISFAIRIVPSICSWVLMSIGAVQENMMGRLYWETASIILILPAAFISLEAIAAALIASSLLGYFLMFHYLTKLTSINLLDHWSIALYNALLTATIGLIVNLVHSFCDYSIFINLLIGSLSFVLSWLCVMTLFKHPIIKELKNLLPPPLKTKD